MLIPIFKNKSILYITTLVTRILYGFRRIIHQPNRPKGYNPWYLFILSII